MQVHKCQSTVVEDKGQVYGVSSLLLTCEFQELRLSALKASDFTHWAILLVPVGQANLEFPASTIIIPSFT